MIQARHGTSVGGMVYPRSQAEVSGMLAAHSALEYWDLLGNTGISLLRNASHSPPCCL